MSEKDYILWDCFCNCPIDDYKKFIRNNPTMPPDRVCKFIKGYSKGSYIEKWLVRADDSGQCTDAYLDVFFDLGMAKKFKLGYQTYLEFERQRVFHRHHAKPIRCVEYVIPPEKWEIYFGRENERKV